ncbi:DUF2804 family protein [Micromonospora sp. CNB394]|uniref:DUF2804 family protein n=1 Tax=Micromonospora sp. CNB394 TaxID=1169151 RepID=UPI002100D441|nr:DUF2804 family protein [Micromonospora sp. CNB394]
MQADSALGPLTRRSIQLGGTWTDGTGSTENAVFVDGRLHQVGADLTWEYDRADWLRPGVRTAWGGPVRDRPTYDSQIRRPRPGTSPRPGAPPSAAAPR